MEGHGRLNGDDLVAVIGCEDSCEDGTYAEFHCALIMEGIVEMGCEEEYRDRYSRRSGGKKKKKKKNNRNWHCVFRVGEVLKGIE